MELVKGGYQENYAVSDLYVCVSGEETSAIRARYHARL